MGNNSSYANLSQEMLDEYAALTYLSKHEIISLFKQFYVLGKREIDNDFHYRFPCECVAEHFLNLKVLNYNPFKERIYQVFSSYKDGHFSFEDMLDFCSIMSHNCPDSVKAKWAFKIFDIDNNNQIDEHDIMITIDLLVGNASDHIISLNNKREIAQILLETMNIQKTGGINELEFEHAVGKMSEFSQTFSFTI